MISLDEVTTWRSNDYMRQDCNHNILHILKALGLLAAKLEHNAHKEPFYAEQKRYADLIIHAIWLVHSMGFEPSEIVKSRMEEVDAIRR